MSNLQVVLSGKCAAHTHLAWTKCCSRLQSPDEARFHDGNFDHSVSSRVFSEGWRVNSTEVVFAAVPPCSTIEVTYNQVNFLRNRNGRRVRMSFLAMPFFFGVNVAAMRREHCKVFLPAHW